MAATLIEKIQTAPLSETARDKLLKLASQLEASLSVVKSENADPSLPASKDVLNLQWKIREDLSAHELKRCSDEKLRKIAGMYYSEPTQIEQVIADVKSLK